MKPCVHPLYMFASFKNTVLFSLYVIAHGTASFGTQTPLPEISCTVSLFDENRQGTYLELKIPQGTTVGQLQSQLHENYKAFPSEDCVLFKEDMKNCFIRLESGPIERNAFIVVLKRAKSVDPSTTKASFPGNFSGGVILGVVMGGIVGFLFVPKKSAATAGKMKPTRSL